MELGAATPVETRCAELPSPIARTAAWEVVVYSLDMTRASDLGSILGDFLPLAACSLLSGGAGEGVLADSWENA